MADFLVEVGRRARHYRELAGFSLRDVQYLIGVHPNTLERIERGEAMPQLPTIVNMAFCYRVSLDDILGLSELEGGEK